MRKIDYIVVHCTGTRDTVSPSSILRYWKEYMKWKNPGYHYLIDRHGNIHQLLPESDISNGVRGHNHNSIHVCYIGGKTPHNKFIDTRSTEQKQSIFNMLYALRTRYPKAIIQGHRDFPNVAKICPCFDAKKEYRFI